MDELAEGACVGHPDPDLWFPDDVRYSRRVQAIRARTATTICRGCPVRPQCADLGKRLRAAWGIWGGVYRGEQVAA